MGNEYLIFYKPWTLFIWGACWGSFLNVVMYRFPLGMSIVSPGSSCPKCQKPIAFYDNLPVLSWLLLRGRCRKCKAPFSPMYAINEAGFGLAAALPVLIFPDEWLKGFSLGMTSLAFIPLFYLLIRYRRAPAYLWAGFLIFGGLHAAQFFL